jgi:nitrile hydratase accessory protein
MSTLRPPEDAGPVFAEPWQAQAFALTVHLSAQGFFTWKEWSSALADELQAAAARGEHDDGSRYYCHWLTALEGLVGQRHARLGSRLTLTSAPGPGTSN